MKQNIFVYIKLPIYSNYYLYVSWGIRNMTVYFLFFGDLVGREDGKFEEVGKFEGLLDGNFVGSRG